MTLLRYILLFISLVPKLRNITKILNDLRSIYVGTIGLNMPSVNCPYPGCNYATPDTEAVIVAALLTTHAAPGGGAKVDRVKHPTIVSSSTSEDWTYFLTRWNEYIQATRVTGREIIIQLLECCEEQLLFRRVVNRKDRRCHPSSHQITRRQKKKT